MRLRTFSPPVTNMSNNPSVGRGLADRPGPGRFQPPFDPTWVASMCNCECSSGSCAVAQPPQIDGIENCFPNYSKLL